MPRRARSSEPATQSGFVYGHGLKQAPQLALSLTCPCSTARAGRAVGGELPAVGDASGLRTKCTPICTCSRRTFCENAARGAARRRSSRCRCCVVRAVAGPAVGRCSRFARARTPTRMCPTLHTSSALARRCRTRRSWVRRLRLAAIRCAAAFGHAAGLARRAARAALSVGARVRAACTRCRTCRSWRCRFGGRCRSRPRRRLARLLARAAHTETQRRASRAPSTSTSLPHAPQFAGSFVSVAQMSLHDVCDDGHDGVCPLHAATRSAERASSDEDGADETVACTHRHAT